MTKRIQRGMRQQTPNMNASDYQHLKTHNMVEKMTVEVLNELPEPLYGTHRLRMVGYVANAAVSAGLV